MRQNRISKTTAIVRKMAIDVPNSMSEKLVIEYNIYTTRLIIKYVKFTLNFVYC